MNPALTEMCIGLQNGSGGEDSIFVRGTVLK